MDSHPPLEIEDDKAGRARGLSFWHWVYYLDNKGYGFYNTRAQALEARHKAFLILVHALPKTKANG
jgi:hypothetical protein